MQKDTITGFLERFAAWASARADVQAVVLVGSYARGNGSALPPARPDSDIDLVIITTQPETYLADLAWPGLFGAVARHAIEDWGMVTSLRVWYDDGREVEYGITTPQWVALPLDTGTRRVLGDGASVLFEREMLVSAVL